MTDINCPNCNNEVSRVQVDCTNCGYPLAGSEKEKAQFIGRQITNKSKIDDAKVSQGKAQKILYFIGAFQLFNAFRAYSNTLGAETIIFYIILGLLLIAFGYFSSKKPLLFTFLALGLILSYYLLLYVNNPAFLFQGIIWKMLIIIVLIYGISDSLQERKLKKKYNFLKND